MRVAKLLQQWSSHDVDLIYLDRAHWRWLALTGHRDISRAIRALDYDRPDAIICSGPADAVKIAGGLPGDWGRVPLAVYFHESQWTYPDPKLDPRPYVVGHLDALEAADAIWFNSAYHLRVFRLGATTNPSLRVRRLAREIIPAIWHKTRVLHPPVQVDQVARKCGPADQPVIAWAARWEREKRPDLFVAAILECIDAGLRPRIQLLGIPAGVESIAGELPEAFRQKVTPESGFPTRADYEAALAESDLWISTAEHEFFGVAAIEAAMLGATPLLPRALAYPETLPSAPTYQPGDAGDLARKITSLATRRFHQPAPWQIDARRFQASLVAARFDELVSELAACR